MCMPRIFHAPLNDYAIQTAISKKTEDLIDKVFAPKDLKWIKEMNQKAARKRAKKLGIKSIPDSGIKIRSQLNERIIQEVKRRKLRHADVRSISLVSRPRFTAIMNRNLHEVSIDLLVRILSFLGVSVNIHFD